MNPLFNQIGQNDMMQKFMDFRKNFAGNPQKTIQEMLNSGRISQAQYNDAVQKANMLKGMFGIK